MEAAEEADAEVDAVTVATAQLQIETAAAAAGQEQEEQEQQQPEPEPEPEECAICLNDLPVAGEAGAVLLVCTHAFHADCLGRWKDKCLEKGLPYTCAMCRGTVVVAPAGVGKEAWGQGEIWRGVNSFVCLE